MFLQWLNLCVFTGLGEIDWVVFSPALLNRQVHTSCTIRVLEPVKPKTVVPKKISNFFSNHYNILFWLCEKVKQQLNHVYTYKTRTTLYREIRFKPYTIVSLKGWCFWPKFYRNRLSSFLLKSIFLKRGKFLVNIYSDSVYMFVANVVEIDRVVSSNTLPAYRRTVCKKHFFRA